MSKSDRNVKKQINTMMKNPQWRTMDNIAIVIHTPQLPILHCKVYFIVCRRHLSHFSICHSICTIGYHEHRPQIHASIITYKHTSTTATQHTSHTCHFVWFFFARLLLTFFLLLLLYYHGLCRQFVGFVYVLLPLSVDDSVFCVQYFTWCEFVCVFCSLKQ